MGATAVILTNPEMVAYFIAENARRTAETGPQISYHTAGAPYYVAGLAWYEYDLARLISLDTGATALEVGLHATQLGLYYDALDDAVDERDAKIDAQWAFMQQLNNYNINYDIPMLDCKKDILVDLVVPEIQSCGYDPILAFSSNHDALALDQKAQHLADEACGVPLGWEMWEGEIHAAKSSSSLLSISAASDKRRIERFRKSKTRLVRTAQSNLKSVFNAGDILSMYAQAASIHSGLADIYLQGFNSAGAGLGVALGKLNNGTLQGTGSPSNPVSNVGGSN